MDAHQCRVATLVLLLGTNIGWAGMSHWLKQVYRFFGQTTKFRLSSCLELLLDRLICRSLFSLKFLLVTVSETDVREQNTQWLVSTEIHPGQLTRFLCNRTVFDNLTFFLWKSAHQYISQKCCLEYMGHNFLEVYYSKNCPFFSKFDSWFLLHGAL